MKKLIPRKLVVRREVLRALEHVELAQVGGAVVAIVVETGDVSCPVHAKVTKDDAGRG